MSKKLKLKLEQFEALFNCQFCEKLLVKPINLPCGATICESHLDESVNDKCKLCTEQHPKVQYQVNIISISSQNLNKMIKLQVNSIKMSPKFDACKESIDKAKQYVDKIDLITKDPENYAYEYFQQIRQKVDIRREELKSQIDNYSDEIISKIDQAQQECVKITKIMEDVSKDIENYKTDLNTLIQRFDSFEFNDEKYDAILSKVNNLHPKLEDILDDYKCSLLDYTDYKFEIEEINMQNFFGSFISYPSEKTGMNSQIINKQQIIELMNLCEFPKHQKYQLIYRASEDGFSSADFHDKCDGVKNTLTIIKSKNGNIFGGYTGAAWSSSGDYINDANSFIYSLINKTNDPFRAKCTKNKPSIIGHASYGPSYGVGCDLFIATNSNLNKKSYSNFGFSYGPEKFESTILAGTRHFQTKEIEAFEILN